MQHRLTGGDRTGEVPCIVRRIPKGDGAGALVHRARLEDRDAGAVGRTIQPRVGDTTLQYRKARFVKTENRLAWNAANGGDRHTIRHQVTQHHDVAAIDSVGHGRSKLGRQRGLVVGSAGCGCGCQGNRRSRRGSGSFKALDRRLEVQRRMRSRCEGTEQRGIVRCISALVIDTAEMPGHAKFALQGIHREATVFLHPRQAIGQLVGRPRCCKHLHHAEHDDHTNGQCDHQLNHGKTRHVSG